MEKYAGFKFSNFHVIDPVEYAKRKYDNGAKNGVVTAPNVIFNPKGKPASIRKLGPNNNFNFYGKIKIHKTKD